MRIIASLTFAMIACVIYTSSHAQNLNENDSVSANSHKRYDFKAACKDCREFIEELEKLINGGNGLSEAYLIISENEEMVLKERGFMSPLHLSVEYFKAKISSLEGDYSGAEKKIYWLFDALEYRKRGQINQELIDVGNYLTEEQLRNLDSLNREAASIAYNILRDKNYLSLSVEDLRNSSYSEISEIVSDLIDSTRFSGFKFEEKYAIKSLEIISGSDNASGLAVYRVNALLALGHLYTTRSRITPISETYQESNRYDDLERGFYYYNQAVEEDKQKADTTAIIQRLNEIVSEAIDIQTDGEDDRVFDISKVNFEVLRKEFAKSERKASDVQDLRTVIQRRLEKMLLENPSLGDFQDRFDEIVVEYNKEKDRNTIEATFEALMRLTAEMEEETQSHVALGLTPEQKPIFDLLIQDDLTKEEIKQIKAASVGLLQAVRKRIEEVQDVFSKQSTRDGLRQEIYDLLYDEQMGLPASKYDEDSLAERAAVVFNFFERRTQHAMAA